MLAYAVNMLQGIFRRTVAIIKPINIRNGVWATTQQYCTGNSKTGEQQTDGEKHIKSVLRGKFPAATDINVQDISGGCGAMYEIQIATEEFRGKRTVMQHRMVNDALKEEIKDMHGLRITTQVPS